MAQNTPVSTAPRVFPVREVKGRPVQPRLRELVQSDTITLRDYRSIIRMLDSIRRSKCILNSRTRGTVAGLVCATVAIHFNSLAKVNFK
jgi:hypothetical protein